MSKTKLIILMTVLIDAIGLGVVIPVLPLYVQSFGVSAFVVTSLFAIFALSSFLASPLLGVLSDKYGRRVVMIYSTLISTIGWFVFAGSISVVWLFIGRVINGLGAGNYSAAQSAMSDISESDKDRTHNIGLTGAAFGMGFVFGPMIGGVLGQITHNLPFIFVAVLSLLNTLLVIFVLPETNHHRESDKKIHWNPLKPLFAIREQKNSKIVYAVFFIFCLVMVGTNAIFSLYLAAHFGLSVRTIGLFLTFAGVIIAFNQAVGLRHFWLKYFHEFQLIVFMLGAIAFGLLFQMFSHIAWFIVGFIFFAFGQSVLRAVLSSQIIGLSEVKRRGEASGVISSLNSLSSVIAPLFIGWIYGFNMFYPFVISIFLTIVAIVLMFIDRKDIKEIINPASLDKDTPVVM
ncbi:MAG: MFS transporter [bacterium]